MSRKVDVFGDRLRSRSHQLTPRLLQVARYINENREAVMEQTAMEIATLLKTSDATVVRAIQALGFAGLRDLKQTLRLGIHHHKHGESHYLFLLAEGVEMNEDDLERNLQEDFEPEHGETLDVERIDTPYLFAPTTEEAHA